MLITEEIIGIAVRKRLAGTGPSCLVFHIDTHKHRTSSCYENIQSAVKLWEFGEAPYRHHLHPRQLPELMDIEESVVLGDSAIREQGEQLLCRGR